MIGRVVGFLAKEYNCGRRFAAFLILGLAVDFALLVVAFAMMLRLFEIW